METINDTDDSFVEENQ